MAKYNWRRHKVAKDIWTSALIRMGRRAGKSNVFRILEQNITPLGGTAGNTIETVPVDWLSSDSIYLTTTGDSGFIPPQGYASMDVRLANFTYDEEVINNMVSDG